MHAADFGLGIYGANAIVGANGAIVTGAAWASARLGGDRVGVSFFGDGAVSQGVLLEAFNLASLWQVPVLFVCENNGWATTMRTERSVAGSIMGRAAAFGIPAESVDGMDAEAVLAATGRAVDRARGGGGPGFLECHTYRFDAHHTFEHKVRLRYRDEEEVARGRSRDPVEIQGGRIPAERRAEIDAEVEALLDEAVRFAVESPKPAGSEALEYLYGTGLRGRAGVSGA
jgi:acetoin:2,6-dichlorophenolindophenol oxidoreductase subunit alpha